MDSGHHPEEDLQEGEEPAEIEGHGEGSGKGAPEAEGGEERLSIFEDFLENLDLEEGDDDEEDKPKS
jgi:hypothetical protein